MGAKGILVVAQGEITIELETDFQPRVDTGNAGLSQCFDSRCTHRVLVCMPAFLPPSLTPLVPHTQLPEARLEVNNKMSDGPCA